MSLIKNLGDRYSIHYEDECFELRDAAPNSRFSEIARIQKGGTIIFSGESACIEHMQQLINIWRVFNRIEKLKSGKSVKELIDEELASFYKEIEL